MNCQCTVITKINKQNIMSQKGGVSQNSRTDFSFMSKVRYVSFLPEVE